MLIGVTPEGFKDTVYAKRNGPSRKSNNGSKDFRNAAANAVKAGLEWRKIHFFKRLFVHQFFNWIFLRYLEQIEYGGSVEQTRFFFGSF